MPDSTTVPTAATVALLPLDERPVNTRYPAMLAEIAGARLMLPPIEARGVQRTPADRDAIADWLRESAKEADAGIVASAEFLLFGNLINSRISGESATDVLPRLRLLEEIGAGGAPVYAFSLITRVSNADDAVEEPDYWATYGTRFYRYSALLHRRDADRMEEGDEEQFRALRREIPASLRADWMKRRLRNHVVNLALLDLVSRERLAFLLLTSDDTSLWGTPSREKAWLESWVALLDGTVADRVMLHPGADEVGCALVARLLSARLRPDNPPRVFPVYAVPGDESVTAPYEDRAVRLTVEGQISACGGVRADRADEADIVLGVLTPAPGRREFRESYRDEDRAARTPYYRDLFADLAAYQAAGIPVALGDVTYPNGADPLAIEMLLDGDCPLDPARLAGYGAWNTAGNTLGTVVAQAVCALIAPGKEASRRGQARFLAHRFLEDWGYQAVVRREAREACLTKYGTYDPDPSDRKQIEWVCRRITAGLTARLQQLQTRGIGVGLGIGRESVRLPWRRTFEVDFLLE